MVATLLSGCSASGTLRWLDDQAGKLLSNTSYEGKIQNVSTSTKEILNQIKDKAASISKDQKAKIDQYLLENNLNRYGDASSTVYTGGTPLFNEITGESVDRFEYILKNHPEIWEKIKQQF